MNVSEVVVERDYCIGCGVCAGVCPKNNLSMLWSEKGELVPVPENECEDLNCSICLDVCPFFDHEINQDDLARELFSKDLNINYTNFIGYYDSCYVGYRKSKNERIKCASGGLATAFLSTILEKKIVDNVAAVGYVENKNRMFDFKILSKFEDVNSVSGSVYYPVELSKVLKMILTQNNEETFAVIALPCVIYGLRLAMERIPKLKRKIKLTSSLTCGQLQNRFCAELLALESGIPVNNFKNIDFRRKSKDSNASNFLQVPIDKDGKESYEFYYHDLPYHLWHYRYFTHNSCSFCDDVFGELADITFMDAWLPEYIADYKGTSLVISRTSMTSDLLKNMQNCELNRIDSKKVVESQKGALYNKIDLLKGRLYRAKKLNIWHPRKRFEPDEKLYEVNKEFIELTSEIQNLSKKIWIEYRLSNSTRDFWKKMNKMEFRIKKYKIKNKISNIFSNYSSIIIQKFKS